MEATIKRWRLTFICSQNQSETEGFGLARSLQPIQTSRSISLLKSGFHDILSDRQFIQKVRNLPSQDQSDIARFSASPLTTTYPDFQEAFLCWNPASAVDSNREIILSSTLRLIRRSFRWVEAQGLLRHQALCHLLQQRFAVRDI